MKKPWETDETNSISMLDDMEAVDDQYSGLSFSADFIPDVEDKSDEFDCQTDADDLDEEPKDEPILLNKMNGKRGKGFDPNSKTQKRLASYTEENLTRKMKDLIDRFCLEYMYDMHVLNAWVRAGNNPGSATRAYELYRSPYFQQQLRRYTEALEEEKLITSREILVGLRNEAYNHESGDCSPTARVNAWKVLAQLKGMLVKKTEAKVTHGGGVMLIPSPPKDVNTWEHEASESQHKLKKDARD